MTKKLREIAESEPKTSLYSVVKAEHLIFPEGKTDVSVLIPTEDLVDRASYDKLAEALKRACDAYDLIRDAALLALDCDCTVSDRLSGHKTTCQVPHIEYKINLADEKLIGGKDEK